MADVLVHPNGVRTNEDGEISLVLCKTCKSSLKSKKVPSLSLANHMVLGDIPEQLQDLTIVEEAMIAKCRATCWVIQLKEENAGYSAAPNTQRGLRGHVIVYE